MNNNQLSNDISFEKGWMPLSILDRWIKKSYSVELYTSMSSKLKGVIKGYDNYNLTIIDDSGLKCIVFKSNVFFIRRLK